MLAIITNSDLYLYKYKYSCNHCKIILRSVAHWMLQKKPHLEVYIMIRDQNELVLLFDLNQLCSDSIYPKPKSNRERLSECSLDSVEEGHGFRDAVEWHNTCTVIQVDPYSEGPRTWELSLYIVVPKYITVCVTT